MKASPVACVALLLALLPTAGFAASPFNPDLRAVPGKTVEARRFQFSALPRATPKPIPGPHEWVGFKVEGRGPAEGEVERLKRHPEPPPLRAFSKITVDPTPAGSGFAPLAPTVGNGFEGIHQSGYIPGEPTVAAGPLNIFTTGNINVVVADKDGSNYHEVTGATFFNVGGGDGPISDAQCYYDALHGRFVAIAFTTGTGATVTLSHYYLAISQTNDARGAWNLYMFDMSLDGATPTNNWADYEGIGVSEDKIAMSGQMFSMGGNQYKYQKMRVISRAAAYSGGPVTYVDFFNFAAPPGGNVNDNFVTKPARNLSAGDSTLHCLCIRTGSGSRVTYRSITGPPSSPTLSAGELVTVSSYSAPPDAVQKNGGSTLVPTNDCRPTDFVVRNGVLVVAFHTSANFGSGAVSAVRLLRLRTSDRAVLTDELYGQDGVFYYYPAVTVDSVGTLFLGFDRSSSTEFTSAWATGKRRGDASLQASALLKTGLSNTTQSRWGDYTGIDNDASLSGPSGSVAWYSGQWGKATNAFGTWVNKLTFTYAVISGTVTEDCDGSTGTTGDRGAIAGVSLALKQGATTLATTTSDATGNYSFGYLESGTYDVVITPPAGGAAVDATAGSGGTSQTRISASDLQVNLTNAQTSTANAFLVSATHATPVAGGLVPANKNAGDPTFTLTVNGSAFVRCAVVRWDGSDRTTSWVSATQLTASIPASDITSPGSHSVRVFNPAPGGGLSGALTFTVDPAADVTPPTVSVTSPNGGETWKAGSSHPITWTATDNLAVTTVDLAWSSDGGATFPNAIASGIANSGSFAWSVPDAPTTQARVRVIAHDAAANAGRDSSDANFTIDRWVITASAGPNGSIAPNGAVGVAEGGSQSFTVTPDPTYHVLDVLVDGSSVGAVTTHPFTNVTANHTIAASFSIDTWSLTLISTGKGVVSRAPNQPSYPHGTLVTLGATPDPGWVFSGWGGDTSTTSSPIQIAMNANRSFTAAFADTAPPLVQVLAPNGGESATQGSHLNLTWTASDNEVVARVDLLLSRGGPGGPFDSIAANVPNTGSYDWVVTGPQTTDALFRVVAHDSATGVASDLSDSAFAIPGAASVRPTLPVTAIELAPVSPNPVHRSGFVSFALPERARIRLSVHDVQGREVQLLLDGEQDAGRHRVAWGDASSLQTGLYFVRLRVGGQTLMRRAVLIR